MHRRHFLQSVGALAGTSALAGLSALEAHTTDKKNIRFAFITDIHVKPDKTAETGMAKALRHVQNLKPKVDFIINGGDSIMDALEATKESTHTQWILFKTILQKENKLPVYHCIGNHDIWGWFTRDEAIKQEKFYGKAWALHELQMQNPYYRFKKNNWHFIVLDSTQLNPAGGYIGRLDDAQFEWLKQELAKIPLAEFVCIVSHIPILSICSGLFFDKNEPNGDLIIKRNLMHTDFLKIKKLFSQYPQIKLCVSGHIHLQDELKYLGIGYYCNGAVSGAWWKGNFQEFSPAYAIFELSADGFFQRKMISYS